MGITITYRACSKCGVEKECNSVNYRAYGPEKDKLRKDCRECENKRTAGYKIDRPHLKRARDAKRRAMKLEATPKWCDLEKVREIYKDRDILVNFFEGELREEFHIDHFYPLQGELVCGLHVPENLIIITKLENLSKNNKHPEDFYVS